MARGVQDGRRQGRRLTVDCRSLASSVASVAGDASAAPAALHHRSPHAFDANLRAGDGLEDISACPASSCSRRARRQVLNSAVSRRQRKALGSSRGQLCLTNARLAFVADKEDANLECQPWDVMLPAIGSVEIHRKPGGRFVSVLELHCKAFRHYLVGFEFEDVADTQIYEFLCRAPGRPVLSSLPGRKEVDFVARPGAPTPVSWGSSLFNAEGTRREYARLGLLSSPFSFKCQCRLPLMPDLPSSIVVPVGVSDAALRTIGRFRSKGRCRPSWHLENGATISRCSQPLVGLVKDRCLEDETPVMLLGDKVIPVAVAPLRTVIRPTSRRSRAMPRATRKGITIVDCRSHTAALGNLAAGRGYEFSANYTSSSVEFHNENIHVMRGLAAVLLSSCALPYSGPRISGRRAVLSRWEGTRWLEHVQVILASACRCARTIHQGQVVLVHCSDGWDRPQITSSHRYCLTRTTEQ